MNRGCRRAQVVNSQMVSLMTLVVLRLTATSKGGRQDEWQRLSILVTLFWLVKASPKFGCLVLLV